MYKQKVILGVAPVAISFLSMGRSCSPKNRFMAVIRRTLSKSVDIIDIDDISENGICWRTEETPAIVEKFKTAGIDALFLPFCDFGGTGSGTDCGIVSSAGADLGARDERPNTDVSRGQDTQCGMFAATKVLRRHGVKHSYIYNCETESDAFAQGYDRFIERRLC